MRKSQRIAELEERVISLTDMILRMAKERDEAEKRSRSNDKTTAPKFKNELARGDDPEEWNEDIRKAKAASTLSSGALAYDRYKLMAETGATDREMGSVPDRARPGQEKKWFTHPTNPNLDGWYS